MKVLTVDDSRTIRMMINKYLAPLNLTILEAGDGKEALEVAQKEHPSLIILDITMPVMDGKETLQRLRSNPELSDIPVIMLTAEGNQEMVVAILKLGVTDYILKPFQAEQLREKVTKILKLNEEKTEPPAAETNSPNNSGKELPKVLIVDDKLSVLEAAKSSLSQEATVLTVQDVSTAFDTAVQYSPQILLIDLVSPGVNVLEIFARMRDHENLKNSRFVAMAIRTMKDEIKRARQAGFHDVLMKPFDQASIIKLLRRNLPNQASLMILEDGYAVFRYPSYSAYEGVTYHNYAEQVLQAAKAGINDLADSGYSHLMIELSALEESDQGSKIVASVSVIQQAASAVGIATQLVAPQGPLAQTLSEFSETCTSPLFNSRQEALAQLTTQEQVMQG